VGGLGRLDGALAGGLFIARQATGIGSGGAFGGGLGRSRSRRRARARDVKALGLGTRTLARAGAALDLDLDRLGATVAEALADHAAGHRALLARTQAQRRTRTRGAGLGCISLGLVVVRIAHSVASFGPIVWATFQQKNRAGT
jgi:hypothetical protein